MAENIFHGELENIMPMINQKVDCIFADFPYGTTKCKWDTPIDLEKFWKEANRILKPNGVVICTAQVPFNITLGASNMGMLRYEWIWEKTNATGHLNANRMPMKAHENVMVFYNRLPTYNPQKTTGHKPVNSFNKKVNSDGEIYGDTTTSSGGGSTKRFPRSVQVFASDTQKSKLHETQKPVALMEYIVKTYTNEGDLVLDPCAGSGTTAVACDNLNRRCILIEKERENIDIIKNRLNEKV
jgi:DNA modification methylase